MVEIQQETGTASHPNIQRFNWKLGRVLSKKKPLIQPNFNTSTGQKYETISIDFNHTKIQTIETSIPQPPQILITAYQLSILKKKFQSLLCNHYHCGSARTLSSCGLSFSWWSFFQVLWGTAISDRDRFSQVVELLLEATMEIRGEG